MNAFSFAPLVLGVDDRVADVLWFERDVPADRGDGLPRAPHLRPLRHLEQARRPVPPPHGAPRLLQQARKTSTKRQNELYSEVWKLFVRVPLIYQPWCLLPC